MMKVISKEIELKQNILVITKNILEWVVKRGAFSTGLVVMLTACGGVKQQIATQQTLDAQRERDALRVAYEAQQLRIKELSDRIIALEDRVMLDHSSNRNVRGAGLWGRSIKQASNRQLPVVKLSALRSREIHGLSETPNTEMPSVQDMREKRLEELGRQANNEGVPTLTAHNIDSFKKKRKKSSPRRIYDAPKGSDQASSLGVVPIPPTPLSSPIPHSVAKHSTSTIEGESEVSDASLVPTTAPVVDSLKVTQDPFKVLLSEAERALASHNWSEANRRYQQILSRSLDSSDQSRARLGLAKVLRGKGSFNEAVKMLRALIQADPSGHVVPTALLEIGDIQLSSGQEAQGRATLMRLKSLYPNTTAARRAESLLQ